MDTALLVIWILCPLVFFLLALWSWLEQSTVVKKGKRKTEEPRDLLSQAIFVTVCSVATFLIDLVVIQGGSIDWMFGEYTPKPLVRFLLYPLVLYIGAHLYGGRPAPRIDKITRASENYKSRHK